MTSDAEPDVRYLIGVVVHASAPRIRVISEPVAPCSKTSVTFTFKSPERAGRCLKLLTSQPDYPRALASAVASGFGYRSANYGEWQIMALLRPGDVWAAVVFDRDAPPPLVVSGSHADAARTYPQLHAKKRFIDLQTELPESVFYQAVLNSIPSFT